MCDCCKDGESAGVPKKIFQEASPQDDCDAMVDKIGLHIKEHYRELRRCVTAVNSMVDTLGSQVYIPPPLGCEHERNELECCYDQQRYSANCDDVVRKYVDCVRNILFLRVTEDRCE